jgi:DNA-directed RNA polymerase specialized sigma subunit
MGIDSAPSLHRLPDDQLEVLVRRLVEGDDSVIPAIMGTHFNLVTAVARKWSMSRYKNFDDCLDCAIEALVNAILKFPSVHRNLNITPYIMSKVMFVLMSEFRRNSVITPLTDLGIEDWSDINISERDETLSKEIIETASLAVRDEEEGKILALVYGEYTCREIATKLGLSKTYVERKRNEIFDRFEYYWTRDEQ